MTVRPLQPDEAPARRAAREADAGAFARAVDAFDAIFEDATRAENRYAGGRGSLRAAVYERAQADVAIAVAAAAAQRASQAMQTILSMQI